MMINRYYLVSLLIGGGLRSLPVTVLAQAQTQAPDDNSFASSCELFSLITADGDGDVGSSSSTIGGFSLAGASSVSRLATAWIEAYERECDVGGSLGDMITIEAGGSSAGASRVCGTSLSEDSVDIGGMTRPLSSVEATAEDDTHYKCERSDRTVIKVGVASEGVSAATKLDGGAATCIKILNGLSLDQLRWIFSSYDETQLIENGWDSTSVPDSDNDPSTHRWSELSSLCPQEEIQIAFPEGSSLLFKELIFSGADESFAEGRNTNTTLDLVNAATNEELVQFLVDNENAISYFELAYVIENIDQELIGLVPIKPLGEEESIRPGVDSFETGIYPLSRRLYMNLYNDETSLQSTRGFLELGFSPLGDDATKSVGLWPIHRWEKVLMRTRAQTATGIPLEDIEKYCPPIDTEGNITIAGSSTVFPVAQIWSEIYQFGCPGIKFTVEGGGSSVGAGRVCGNPEHGGPVDIGDMSREWKDSEAAVVDEFLYQCKEPGDTTRSAIQVDVAIDGLTVAVKEGGTAWECIEALGGLTTDQLRWIYSDYSDSQLEETGWDPASLKNSDRNPQTHLWSELDDRCARVEIRIAGADDLSGTYEYFLETILTDHGNGESFDLNRPGFGYKNSDVDEELVAYLNEFAESISYFGYAYYFENRGSLHPVPIVNDEGTAVVPDPETIGDGSYNPLSRRIYMNLYNDEDTLALTAPFVQFGLSKPEMVSATGYVPLPETDVDEMVSRTNAQGLGSATSNGRRLVSQCIFTVWIAGSITLAGLLSW